MASSEPLYEQIVNTILSRIRSGHYRPGEKLPGQLQLAREFSVSAITTNRALQELERRGAIDRRERRGSFVAEAPTRLASTTLILPRINVATGGQAYNYIQSCLRAAEAREIDLRLLQREQFSFEHGAALIGQLGDAVLHLSQIPEDLYQAIANAGKELVMLGVECGAGQHFVTEARRAASNALVNTLMADGYQRIGFIGNFIAPNHRLCRAGYLDAVAPLGYGMQLLRDADDDSITSAVADLMTEELGVDAIVVAGGNLPIAALPEMLTRRPGVALACFAEADAILSLAPHAYIAKFEHQEIGNAALELLAKLYRQETTGPSIHHLPFELITPG